MENKTVNILGEEYSIMFVDEYPERFSDFEESTDALCNFYDKLIYVLNPKEKHLTEDGKINLNKRKLRHEIVHAFLFEVVYLPIHMEFMAHGLRTRKWLTGLQYKHQKY